MTFRNPLAWIGLAALIVPIAIHLLVRAPAQPIVLASLRFVSASPMRALRRRLLNDGGLLALRLLILAFAVAALADPLATPACRRNAWNARLARAVVADPRAPADAVARAQTEPAAFASAVITPTGDGGVARALTWLASQPPARREVVLVGPLTLGSVDERALRAAPPAVGLRFVRTPAPAPAPPPATRVTTIDPQQRLLARAPRVTFADDRLLMAPGDAPTPTEHTIDATPQGWQAAALGLEVIGPASARQALRAALLAALAVGVPISSSDRAQPLVVLADPTGDIASSALVVAPVSAPWMADAIEAMTGDGDLAHEARGVNAVVADAPAAPWRTVLRDARGHALAAVAATTPSPAALVVRVRAPATSPVIAAVLRGAASSRFDTRALTAAEVLPIPDAQLTAWTRQPGDVDERTLATPRESDRSWLWAAALVALGAEALVRRRSRRARTAPGHASHDRAA